MICDESILCFDQADEKNCKVNDTIPSCMRSDGVKIPIRNETRCGARLISYNLPKTQTPPLIVPFCSDFLDQTNCSDYSRVALHCPVKGHMSTVAKQFVCPETDTLIDKEFPNVLETEGSLGLTSDAPSICGSASETYSG